MTHILQRINNVFHPDRYQGWGKTSRYFEGWYFKLLNKDGSEAFAIIPGIAMDEHGNKQSFIQVLDGKRKSARYHKFSFEDFSADKNAFQISIGNNFFSPNSIKLDIEELQGELRFSNNIPWPKSIWSPGIMGPFSFVPFMECYHGIVSMNHEIAGQLLVNGISIDFNGGKGYLEKDWGKSFPSSYIWLQTNHFSEENISLKCSVAKIPWLGSSFIGFIAGFWWKDRLIRFTTYNQSTRKKTYADIKHVIIALENKQYLLEIYALRDAPTALASPILGLMDGRIEETMNAVVHVTLTEKKSGKVVFDDKGLHAGLEVAGNIEELFM